MPGREDFREYAERHAALSDPTRVYLLYLICAAEARKSPATVTELAGIAGVSASAVSRHVAQLGRAGYVVAERVGKSVHFTTDLGICAELRAELQPQLRLRVGGRRSGVSYREGSLEAGGEAEA